MSQDDWNQGFVTGVVAGVSTVSTVEVPGGMPRVALSHTFVMGLVVPTYVTLVLKS